MANPIEDASPRATAPRIRGSGLWKADTADGTPIVTNTIRRIAGRDGQAGGNLITAGGILLALLAAGFFLVSLKAQQVYVFDAKHISWVSWIEAVGLDAGLVIFSLLALGLSRRGMPSRTERILIMVCAGASALMNYAAADVGSPRSVLAYVMPPIFLAVCVDRLIAVVRRWVLGHDDHSAWVAGGRAALSAGRVMVLIPLYALRLPLAPKETTMGLRRAVLDATPLPGSAPRPAITAGPLPLQPGESKAACLRRLYEGHPGYGDRSRVGRVAAELAPLAELAEGSARTTLYRYLDGLAGERQ